MTNKQKKLLFLISYGPDARLERTCKESGYSVTNVKTLRKALGLIKQLSPDVIVAEFIYAPTYGSQLSNFESLFAAAQSHAPQACFIALCHQNDLQHLDKVKSKDSCCYTLILPASATDLKNCLQSIDESL